MKWIEEKNIRQFEPWAGARNTHDRLWKNGDLDAIEEMLEDYMEDTGKILTATEINDFLWFDTDQIAEWLGFEDWEHYCEERDKHPFKD